MTDEKKKVLRMPRRATESGRTQWNETAEEDGFMVGIPGGRVLIQKQSHLPHYDDEQPNIPRADEGGAYYSATLFNDTGRELDEVVGPDFVRPLYLAARSSALDSGSIFQSMISGLREMGVTDEGE